jgi:NADH:ubiquinone oxidoreductase subunit C
MKQKSQVILLNYRDYLKKLFPHLMGFVINGELVVKISSKQILKFLTFLKLHTLSQYKVLSDICAVDYIWKKNRFALIYNFLSITYNSRITVTCFIEEKTNIFSISSLYNAAGWFEREIWDMFGIFFTQNKDLRRILTDYGFKGHPLRKDFPLTGFFEVRYFNNQKRILAEKVSLAQDYRTFYFNNNWNKSYYTCI